MTKLGVAIFILQLAALQLVAGTSYEDCEVYYFRIHTPMLEVNSWDCVCKPSGDDMPVALGIVNNKLSANETSPGRIRTQVMCFNNAYYKYKLKSLCQSDAKNFMEVAKPLLAHCLEEANENPPVPGPYKYSRENCKAYFTEALHQGADAAAAYWLCECPQPKWEQPNFPMPSVIDGRAMYHETKTAVTNFMRHCTAAYAPLFTHICRSQTDYTQFRDIGEQVYKLCCEKAKASGINTDCAFYLSARPATKTIQSYPLLQHGLPSYGTIASFGY